MLFFKLIAKNLLNRKARTALTVAGISIGIATIVIFGMVTDGLKNTMSGALRPGSADFTVAKANVADMILSVITTEQVEAIRQTEGVESVAPYVMALAKYRGNPYFVIGGIDPKDAGSLGVKLFEGRIYEKEDEIALGRIAAKNYGLGIGDTITLNEYTFKIVGIFESGVTMQDSGGATILTRAQLLNSMKSDQVSMALVKVKQGEVPREVADRIEQADRSLISIVDVADYDTIDQGMSVIDSVSWAISALAMLIGGIGVMNTIIMSVFERTREIGVLRAVGWKRRRIMAMILGEASLLGIASAVLGVGLGLAVMWGVMNTDMGKSWLEMRFDSLIFLRALAVALCVVIIGASYPAYRASRFSPMEALRYE